LVIRLLEFFHPAELRADSVPGAWFAEHFLVLLLLLLPHHNR